MLDSCFDTLPSKRREIYVLGAQIADAFLKLLKNLLLRAFKGGSFFKFLQFRYLAKGET